MTPKTYEMDETLAYGYSSESAERELSNEYQHDRVWVVFKKYLHPCVMDESSPSIGRVNIGWLDPREESYSLRPKCA